MNERKDHSEYWLGFRRHVLRSSYEFPTMGVRIGEFTGKTLRSPHYHLVAWNSSRREGYDGDVRFIRCGIVIKEKDGPGSAKKRFDRLLEFRDEIDKSFETWGRLDWDRKDNRMESQILLWREVDDPENKADWSLQYEWLGHRLETFFAVFPPYIESVETDPLA